MKKDRDGSEPLTIGALAEATGVKVETIRYYERIGILPSPPRSPGGHRLYGPAVLRRLGFVRRARELGFALDEVRDLLRLVDGGDFTCEEVRAKTLPHLDEVRAKIASLRRLEAVLAEVVDRCAGGTAPECPIVDALYGER